MSKEKFEEITKQISDSVLDAFGQAHLTGKGTYLNSETHRQAMQISQDAAKTIEAVKAIDKTFGEDKNSDNRLADLQKKSLIIDAHVSRMATKAGKEK